MSDLSEATNAEIVQELEWRASQGRPVSAQCPNCVRRDALVSVECADCGIALFPLRGRMIFRLATAFQKILTEAETVGVTEQELRETR